MCGYSISRPPGTLVAEQVILLANESHAADIAFGGLVISPHPNQGEPADPIECFMPGISFSSVAFLIRMYIGSCDFYFSGILSDRQ